MAVTVPRPPLSQKTLAVVRLPQVPQDPPAPEARPEKAAAIVPGPVVVRGCLHVDRSGTLIPLSSSSAPRDLARQRPSRQLRETALVPSQIQEMSIKQLGDEHSTIL